jgi:NAD(P) transhydrogenase subunit alpha
LEEADFGQGGEFMSLSVAVLREQADGERRVALDPASANQLAQSGFQVLVEKGAGEAAGFADEQYADCVLLDDPELIVTMADIWLWVQVPATEQLANLPDGRLGIGLVYPHRSPAITDTLNQHRHTCLAMELVPCNNRTRSMDVLSSQATIAGYSAVLRAAQLAPRVFPMLTTPAGTLNPARVVVIGAGVAGLQAIATARRLGARVEVYEPGPIARETVESLGALLISADTAKDDQHPLHEKLTECLAGADVVISTVALPGISAPKLISETMLDDMRAGSVIVDLAAESGGNCELTVPGETMTHNGVVVDGPLNLASEAANHASVMYARSLLDVLDLVVDGESIVINRDSEVIDGILLTHDGKLVQRDVIDPPADA